MRLSLSACTDTLAHILGFVKAFCAFFRRFFGIGLMWYDPSVFSERFEEARKRAGVRLTDCAAALEKTDQTLRLYRRGKGEIKRADMHALARFLIVSPDWLAGATDDPGEVVRVSADMVELPMYDVPGGPAVVHDGPERGYAVLKCLVAGNDNYVLAVIGESMQPTIRDGDKVLMQPWHGTDVRTAHNRVCAVLVDGESTLKRVQIQRDGEHTIVILKGDRADYPIESFVLGSKPFTIQGVARHLVGRAL